MQICCVNIPVATDPLMLWWIRCDASIGRSNNSVTRVRHHTHTNLPNYIFIIGTIILRYISSSLITYSFIWYLLISLLLFIFFVTDLYITIGDLVEK